MSLHKGIWDSYWEYYQLYQEVENYAATVEERVCWVVYQQPFVAYGS